MKNIILISYIDLMGQALLSLLNESHIPLNAKGKYSIRLTYQNKKRIMFFMESHLKNNIYYGKKTVVLQTCPVEANWRNNLGPSWKSIKYKISDSSVWVDPLAMRTFFDKEFERLKQVYDACTFISVEDVDSYDLKLFVKKLLSVNCFNDKGYNIIEDGNNVFGRSGEFPDFVLNSIESELRVNQLIM